MKWKIIHGEFHDIINAKDSRSAAKKLYRLHKALPIIRVQAVDDKNTQIYTYNTDNLSFEKKNHRSHI